MAPVLPEAVVDGAVVDAVAVRDAVRRLFNGLAFSTKDVAVSLSGPAVIVKKISLPPIRTDELGDSIRWEVRQHIPFDSNDVNVDYEVVTASSARWETGDLTFCSLRPSGNRVEDYTAVVSQAACTPLVLDVDAFALQNAYELNYGCQVGRVEVLANVGVTTIKHNVIRARSRCSRAMWRHGAKRTPRRFNVS